MKKLLLLLLLITSINASAQLRVPSGFTPNNDGKNDLFKILNVTTEKIIEVSIYNRCGTLLYHAEDNSGWDGKFNGIPQDIGVYVYLIKYTHDDSLEIIKGNITLIR
jgi:gliding motility-associated-like protein